MNVIMQTLSNLNRRQIRYWCFRLETESTGGTKVEGCPEGLKEHFEGLMWFPGWDKFGITWDVMPTDPLAIMPLKQSLESKWNEELHLATRELTANK